MLESEFNYFKENHESLLQKYPNKFLVIKDKNVILVNDTFEGALSDALEIGLKIGSFLIQLCSEGKEGYSQTFHSRVIFA